MRRLLLCALLLLTAIPGTAQAAGLPLPTPYSGRVGATAPGGDERLVTRRAGRDTLVRAVRRSDGRVLRARVIEGRWAVPAVTLNGGTTGLSADGGTLVLGRSPRSFPPPRTHLATVDAHTVVVRREITLRGLYTVDAISPDGRWLYVIEYPGEDLLDYHVRALDTRTGRLDPRYVVDPRNPDEQMGGMPMARAVSRDGRWAYTLYTGGEETFIHALDTVGRTAACIDLEMLPPTADLSRTRLVVRSGRIDVRELGSLIATVDTDSFAVTEPGEEDAAALAAGGAVAVIGALLALARLG
ncbi:MAG TPA: hypothetical protein VFX51_22780 [Solirubrobacteraceae bacterium]|nr:hypothetical protein [Solirubrobacteraceae bacterium]